VEGEESMSENDDQKPLRMEPRRPQVGDAIAVRVTKLAAQLKARTAALQRIADVAMCRATAHLPATCPGCIARAELAPDDRLGTPVIDLPEKATPEQLRADVRALRVERRALLAEREEDRAEQARRDTEYLDESLDLVAELEKAQAALDGTEKTLQEVRDERDRLAAEIAEAPAAEASPPNTTCACGHPRSQHWGNDAHPACHEPLPPFGDDGSCDTCRCMGFVAAPAPLYYLLSEKWTQGDYITWWRADSRGYTRRLADAGKYTREEARRIAHYSVIPVRCEEAEALAVRVVALNDDSRKWLRLGLRWKRMLESKWKREHPSDAKAACPCCTADDVDIDADCFCPETCPTQCERNDA
jgi:hypothetical protein